MEEVVNMMQPIDADEIGMKGEVQAARCYL